MGRGQKINAWTSKVGELKKEVKRMLITSKGSVEEMNMIDEIQRLGVAYHFEKEINDALEHIYDANVDYDDLKTVALRFRLLRQEGCNIPCDVFNKFKDGGSNFKEGLISDVEGLLSLYEAAFYGTHGEDTLDEAISFTRGRPASLMTHLDGPLAAQVGHALELPMSKRIPRLEARFYISLFQQQKQPNDALLELVKLDFNLVQSMHRIELKELTSWWKDIDIAAKYPFARDQLVEGYLWILGVYFEPQYARARNLMVKMFKLISIVDDIFDTKVVVQGYFKEAEWLNNGYVPTLEEYLEVSLITCGYLYLTGASYVGVGEEATEKAFDWLKTNPKFVMDSSSVCRLVDDIHSNEFEQKRPHIASAVDYYMKEHGVSRPEACYKLREMAASAWKDMNKFCI
ncbi:hypothetical protein MRB53_010685 [Persea americana]|uniref:Uncharacterized protein n=1 Tax=Persea americana TaxID=3435 RepID=A0ACC2LT99_PERAE|nr:hypothetical protein MRB53_010685 [Persea americana]